jgi:hypothetical protein
MESQRLTKPTCVGWGGRDMSRPYDLQAAQAAFVAIGP